MTWANNLRQAAFRGIEFEVLSTTDQGARAHAAHELPYANGADVEDLGLRAARIQLQALLRGADYEARLQVLLAALQVSGPGTLVHPVLGELRVLATDWDVQHVADMRDACAVTLTFLEAGSFGAIFEAPAPSALADRMDAELADARTRATDGTVSILERIAGGPLPRVTEITAAFDRAKTTLRALVDTTSVRLLLSDLEPLIYPRAALADLASVVDQAFQGLPFGGFNALFSGASGGASSALDLPAALDDFGRVAAALDAPRTDIRPLTAEPQEVEVCAALTAYVRTLQAQAVGQAVGIVYAAEAELQQLDRRDVERLANVARSGMQAAITAGRSGLGREHGARAAGSLARAAHEVQQAARSLIEQRPPVVARAAPVGGHPRLVAHALYGDHNRASELVRLNRLGRRVLIERGEELLAYAA